MLGRPVASLDSRSTLFVNHVHDLSFLSQTRIARFLMQNTSARSLPGPRVRVIVSTCSNGSNGKAPLVKSLDEQIHEFRILEIPPLRGRKEDIPAIVANLLKRIASERGGKRAALKPGVLDQLMRHQWLDNVRELREVLGDAMRSSRNGSLQLPPSFFDEVERVKETIGNLQTGKAIRVDDLLGAIEKTLIHRVLMRWDFNLARSSRALGLPEQNLRYRIRKYRLHLPSVRKRK
jgi:DNA-binding NtrC family response regulator